MNTRKHEEENTKVTMTKTRNHDDEDAKTR